MTAIIKIPPSIFWGGDRVCPLLEKAEKINFGGIEPIKCRYSCSHLIYSRLLQIMASRRGEQLFRKRKYQLTKWMRNELFLIPSCFGWWQQEAIMGGFDAPPIQRCCRWHPAFQQDPLLRRICLLGLSPIRPSFWEFAFARFCALHNFAYPERK